jgi:glycosyltransferase involved in cell wall biosynthesis
MRIGIDGRLTYYRTGGISTYIRRLVLALEALDPSNDYTVFHSRKASDRLGSRFRRGVLWTPSHHRLERFALSVELAPHRLDVYHSPDFIPPQYGGRRHIITVHDLNFLHYPQYLTDESRHYYNDQIAWAVRHADHILADSEASRQDMVSMLGVPAAKITVHMLGVDESFRPLPAAELAEALHTLKLPPRYLLFVGTFEPRKNIAGLLEAYQQLVQRLPDAPPLVLAGHRGWLFDETMSRIDGLHLGERVLWREGISQALMPALYNGAVALVTPSFYEGFGLPALEAMACGTVPIVSNRSSLPEVVGPVGLQVEPEDSASIAAALEQAVCDDDWRARMVEAGIARAQTFTWDNTARIVRSVYEAAAR